MKLSRIFLFPLFILSFVVSNQTIFAQTLPAKVKSYLDNNYPSWKVTEFDKACPSETKQYVVEGDFNGDRKQDYAIKFTRGKKGYIIAFVAGSADYKAFVLRNTDSLTIRSLGLGISRKGEEYAPNGIDDENNPRLPRLKNDAFYTIICESDAGKHYIYQNGRFQ